MSTGRRIGIVVAVSLTLLALVGAGAWLFWLPSEIEDRVRAAAARRGLHAQVAGVSVGFDDVELRGVTLTAGEGALRLRIDALRTGVGPFDLASDGTAAIRRLTVHGVRVTAQLDDPSLPGAIEGLRPEAEDEEETSARAEGRHVSATDIEVLLRDEDGTLLEASGGEVTLLPEGVLRVAIGPLSIARGDPDGADIETASARAERSDDGWRLTEARVQHTRVRYAEREGEEQSPLWDRLRRHGRLLADDEAEQVDEAEQGDEDEPVDSDADSDDSDAPESPSSARAAVRVLELAGERLSEGAQLHLEDLAVVASSDEGETGVLSELDADVRALPEGRYRLEGQGRPGRGGRMSWDFTVEPSTLHAEGSLELSRVPFVLLVPVLPRLPWHQPEDARVDGNLRIEGSGVGRAHVSGHASIDDLALASERIAPTPVRRIRLAIEGDADWIPRERRLEVSRARLGLADAAVDITGSLEWPEDHYLIDATVTLPPTDCNAAVGAIPADLLGELAAFTFTGRIGGRVAAHVDSRDLDATTLQIHVANACEFQTAPQLADVRRFEAPFTHRVVEPDDTVFEMETGPGSAQWTPISEISPFFVHAVLGHEDAGFFRHEGFSTSSIRLALVRNLRQGRYVYGASTITMQLVKNVFLRREKTLARKVQEVLLTWWLESVMEKARILELYLNVIEYGPQVYGIRAAAQHYFGRLPSELGPAQSAYLATILPNPKAFHSHYEEDALPARHRRRTERFLRTLGSRGRYDQLAVDSAIADLEGFDFHQPGEPIGLIEPPVGTTAPLPIDGIWSVPDPWEEEEIDPDPTADEPDDGWDSP